MEDDLLKKITECFDEFAKQKHSERLAAIIGGEAIIQHGIPRTTVDIDILFHCDVEKVLQELSEFLKQKLGNQFQIETHKANLFDPLKHDLIILKNKDSFIKLDILLVAYKWEIEGLKEMRSANVGILKPLLKPYLVMMKLIAGGTQDNEDIKNLFFVMDESEKQKAIELAKLNRRDKNLNKIIKEFHKRQQKFSMSDNW